MNSLIDPRDAVDAALPDERVVADVLRVLHDAPEEREITIRQETGTLRIPALPPIHLVTKAYFQEYFDLAFGSGFRVQVAIGDVQVSGPGRLQARYCFATLYYTADRNLITIDFHRDLR